MSFTELRLQLAAARDQLRHAKDTLDIVQAEAEQRAIDVANGSIGKNEAERTRALTLALAHDARYIQALSAARRTEAEVDRLDALLEGARDARRVEEWAIRARLADALIGANVQSDHHDPAGDAAFDDVTDYAAMQAFSGALNMSAMESDHQPVSHTQAQHDMDALFDYDQGVRF